jgi:hypothetical protein
MTNRLQVVMMVVREILARCGAGWRGWRRRNIRVTRRVQRRDTTTRVMAAGLLGWMVVSATLCLAQENQSDLSTKRKVWLEAGVGKFGMFEFTRSVLLLKSPRFTAEGTRRWSCHWSIPHSRVGGGFGRGGEPDVRSHDKTLVRVVSEGRR